MPLLDQTNTEISTEAKQELAAKRIKRTVIATYGQLQNAQSQLAQAVFANPQGLTPQQVFDALGTEAGELVALNAALISFLSTITGEAVSFTPPVAYTISSDGTITVSE